MEMKDKNINENTPKIEFSDEQIEIFARRIMPEIKRFFADEKVKKEFREWRRKRQGNKAE
jgi:hypothetical protein